MLSVPWSVHEKYGHVNVLVQTLCQLMKTKGERVRTRPATEGSRQVIIDVDAETDGEIYLFGGHRFDVYS